MDLEHEARILAHELLIIILLQEFAKTQSNPVESLELVKTTLIPQLGRLPPIKNGPDGAEEATADAISRIVSVASHGFKAR